ncbi:MAG: hypothetical protein AAFQ94_04515 [Bacteroidota bacterium]
MIHLYTDQYRDEIERVLSNIEGLSEAVIIKPMIDLDAESNHVLVTDQIIVPIPWNSTEPPILFEPIPFQVNDLIAILLTKLMYEQEALNFCDNEVLRTTIKCRLQLRDMEHKIGDLQFDENSAVAIHNHAVLAQYARHFYNNSSTENLYENAIKRASSEVFAAFTAKHYATFLMDSGSYSEAESLLRKYQGMAQIESANFYLQLDLINVLMASRLLPYQKHYAEEIKQLIWEAVTYFEQEVVHWAIASLYMNASEIANYEKSYSESLGYINKVISIYETHHFPEFLASAFIRKGTLLYTWAQDDNPQFFQAAIDTYQKGLQTFTREDFPDVHAEIHHHLAVIYAEMPVDEKKKAMWSAFSATSFKESLAFYQKANYPFEYSIVANNYANALLKYPPAKTGDNAEKAIFYYLEALEVRDAYQFPLERAHTILNYLEACWRVQNVNKSMERARYKDMLAKAKEVKLLTDNQELIDEAQSHLDQISALGLAIMTD